MSITVTYRLNPPADIQAGNLSTTRTQSFPVTHNAGDDNAQYYGTLHKTIEQVKDQLGNELTAWRDAVGKAESTKETPKTLKYDADEEEDEE